MTELDTSGDILGVEVNVCGEIVCIGETDPLGTAVRLIVTVSEKLLPGETDELAD